LWLQNSIIDSDLSFLSNFINLVEVDLSSAVEINWTYENPFVLLTSLEVLELRDLGLSANMVEKFILSTQLDRLTRLDLSSKRLEYLPYLV
jgi:hypothetical protein